MKRISLLLLSVIAVSCSGSGPDASKTNVDDSVTLTAAPFQQSAFTLIGHGARLTASTFERLSATLTLAGGKVDALTLSVEPGSLVGSDVGALAQLRGEEGLGRKPTSIRFRSTSIRQDAAGTLDVSGQLSIAGRNHDVRVPLRLRTGAAGYEIDLRTEIGAPAWRNAVGARHDAIFSERLEALAHLVFPRGSNNRQPAVP